MNKARHEAAKRYAAADKSDPFALARAITHMKNGIAGFRQERGEHHAMGQDAFYTADETYETRTYEQDGRTVEYQVLTYRNRVRP